MNRRTLKRFGVSALLAGLPAALHLFATTPARAQAGAEAALLTLHSVNSARGASGLGDRFRLPEFPGSPNLVSGSRPSRPAALPPRPRSGAPGAVAGRLVDESGSPVAGVPVGLLATDPRYAPEYLEVVSDSAGEYHFEAVEPGPWELRFDPTKMPAGFAPRRAALPFTLDRRETEGLPAVTLLPGACVAGSVTWRDGQPALETEIFFAPADTAFYSVVGRVDGEGQFRLCGIPAGPVHSWSDLGDGRWLGQPLQLEAGAEGRIALAAEPASQLRGVSVWFDVRLTDGRSVPMAEIVVVGGREAPASEFRLVYLRGGVTDRGGAAEFLLPYGRYEVLAMNPREGEWVRLPNLVLTESTGRQLNQDLALEGTSTAEERAEWVAALRERAEQALYLWHEPVAAAPAETSVEPPVQTLPETP